MTHGLYDTFPVPPNTFPGHIRWFPGPFLIKILRLVHKFSGSVVTFFVSSNSSYAFPGSPDWFPGPPGTFPGHIGPFP